MMMKLLVSFSLLLTTSLAIAGPNDWKELASGHHSFKTLGPAFYEDVPVRRIPDARVTLSFVNRDLVKELGLDLPQDPAAAEKMLLDLFAWEVDPTGTSSKKWFATHYQDSNEKGPGSAQGDGRALWTGELQLKQADGKILYVDGVQKGVGPTPFAWLNNKTHSDGRQTTEELIISGIRSTADIRNQLDSTGDLIGFTILDPDGRYRSMSLRVGRQTRPAHVRYHSDNEADEAKMMDYIVKRDLGLPMTHAMTDTNFLQWENQFARTNAEDTARVFALIGFYEHPTMGNKTTTGGTIDLNGRQYLDAYHVNMTHLNNKLFVGDQVQIQKDYIRFVNGYLQTAKYRMNVNTSKLTSDMNEVFNQTFRETASLLFLRSLGLDDDAIKRVPIKTRMDFLTAVNKLMRATAPNKVNLVMNNKNVQPALFNTRKILKGTLAALSQQSRSQRRNAFAELYKVDFKWAAADTMPDQALTLVYEQAVRDVIQSVGGRVQPQWLANAQLRTRGERYDSTSDGIWDQRAHPIRKKAESGEVSWVEISDLMDQAADTFVDPQLPSRESAMLKWAPAAEKVETPPNSSHVETKTKLPFGAPVCSTVVQKAG